MFMQKLTREEWGAFVVNLEHIFVAKNLMKNEKSQGFNVIYVITLPPSSLPNEYQINIFTDIKSSVIPNFKTLLLAASK